jgi:septal ring factor EnvC (AmiA/AmiB activator)
MKVYVLHYAYYEESEVRGVYTEDAMRKELAQYAEWGRKHNEKSIAEQERRIEELKKQRKELGQEDRKIQEKQAELKVVSEKIEEMRQLEKNLRHNRKEVARKMDQLAMSIRNQEYGLKKMKSLTDNQLAEREMERSHLYFEEFYVLGME